MKLFAFIIFSTSIFSSFSMAATVPARISYLSCSASEFGVGGVAITYTGEGFNITESNAFGFPFSQQASIKKVTSHTGKDITFDLLGNRTGLIYKLEIKGNSGEAKVSTEKGSMNLTCVGDIQAI